MNKASQAFLTAHFPQLLTQDNLDKALLDLDAFITREGLDINDDMTPFGHEAQAIYDDIYASND